jgi:hypothetical protein
MFHTNKRNKSDVITNAIDKLNLGIRNNETLSVFDRYVIPTAHIIDPQIEMEKYEKYGDAYENVPIEVAGVNKVDTRNYRRVFPDTDGVAKYIKNCEKIFLSKTCRINIFLNDREADELLSTIVKERTHLNDNPFSDRSVPIPSDRDQFILDYLKENEIQEVTGLKLKEYGVTSRNQTIEMDDDYWPQLNCPRRSRDHITNPLVSSDWKDDDISDGASDVEEDDTCSHDENIMDYFDDAPEVKRSRKNYWTKECSLNLTSGTVCTYRTWG